jgi:hypothetical protein
MYAVTRASSLQRSIRLAHPKRTYIQQHARRPLTHRERVAGELRELGVTGFGMLRMESRYLPHIIHSGEHLKGVVYGRHKDGFAMLVATDRRVVFLDKKPLFANQDEVTYDVVTGVNLSTNGIGKAVTLHTRVKDFEIRTYNGKCARGFVSYIEKRRVERLNHEQQAYA